MARAGFLFGLAALLAFIAGLFIPGVGIFISFISVIALGWGAGYTAAKTTGAGPGQGTGRGAGAGAIAGLVVLIGLVVVLVALGSFLLSIPEFQAQFNQALQQSPELEGTSATGVLGAGLAFAGGLCGIVNLLLMTIAGLIGGMMWKGAPASTGYSTTGTGYGSTGPGYGSGGYGSTGYGGTTDTTGTGYGGTTDTTGTTYGTGTDYGSTGTTYGDTGTSGARGSTGPGDDIEPGVRVYDDTDRNR